MIGVERPQGAHFRLEVRFLFDDGIVPGLGLRQLLLNLYVLVLRLSPGVQSFFSRLHDDPDVLGMPTHFLAEGVQAGRHRLSGGAFYRRPQICRDRFGQIGHRIELCLDCAQNVARRVVGAWIPLSNSTKPVGIGSRHDSSFRFSGPPSCRRRPCRRRRSNRRRHPVNFLCVSRLSLCF